MRVENTMSDRIPLRETGTRDTVAGDAAIALAEHVASVTVSPRRVICGVQSSQRTVPTPSETMSQQFRARPPHLGPTLGVDFGGTLRSLHAQTQYQSAVKLMAEKLVEFTNNKPSGWHFDLYPQAESAMENFYLTSLPPRLRERYEKKKDDIGNLSLHVKKFSRLFFFASATPLPQDRLKAYARRWMEVKTKVPYLRVRVQRFIHWSKPHLSIPRDAYTALILELPKVCGATGIDRRTAALFCASGFGQLINHITFESVAHPKARAHMHVPDHKLMSFDAHLNFLTEDFSNPEFDADFIVERATTTSLSWLHDVKLGESAPAPSPSAPPVPSTSL